MVWHELIGCLLGKSGHIVTMGYNGIDFGIEAQQRVGLFKSQRAIPFGINRGYHANMGRILQSLVKSLVTQPGRRGCHIPCKFNDLSPNRLQPFGNIGSLLLTDAQIVTTYKGGELVTIHHTVKKEHRYALSVGLGNNVG